MAVSCKLNSVLVSFFHLFKSHAVLFSFGIQRKRHFLQKLLPMDLDRRLQFSDIILKCKTTIPTSFKKKHILWELLTNTKHIWRIWTEDLIYLWWRGAKSTRYFRGCRPWRLQEKSWVCSLQVAAVRCGMLEPVFRSDIKWCCAVFKLMK